MDLTINGNRNPLLASVWTQFDLNGCRCSGRGRGRGKSMVIIMRDRGKNRKPLQRGRNLSIEAIQAVQALKRANYLLSPSSLDQVFDSKFRRLLKFDMMAVLHELIRQNECVLALQVFADIRKEYWYKSKVSLYADVIAMLAKNELFQEVERLYATLKAEKNLEPEIEAFNTLLETLMTYKIATTMVMDCYYLMKSVGCEPNRLSYKLLINGLESIGEMDSSAIVRQDAYKYYGDTLDLRDEEEKEDTTPTRCYY